MNETDASFVLLTACRRSQERQRSRQRNLTKSLERDREHPGSGRPGRDYGLNDGPVPFKRGEAVSCRLALAAGQHKPADAAVDPHLLLNGPVADSGGRG
jgi:hypothetical protein